MKFKIQERSFLKNLRKGSKRVHYCILASLFYLGAMSQENISLDQQLSLVNQSSVTSGIIYERVMQIANLYNFNKTTNFNTANFNYFKQALMEMNKASNGTKFITLPTFKNLVATTLLSNEVDIAILNTQFNIINFNEQAPAQGGLTFNTATYKFRQNAGKEPFYMLHNTVIAPAKDIVAGSAVTYKIRNDLYFKNGTKVIKTLVANFGDGVNRTLISNQVLTNQNIVVNYPSSGDKISTFQVTYTDGTTMTTYGKVYFKYANEVSTARGLSCSALDPLKQDFQLQADIPFTGYAAGDPKIKAKIDYRIFYANADKKLRKPIIIIDGFDPGDKRKIQDCDCEYDTECEARNKTNGVFDPQKHRAMVDLVQYYDYSITPPVVDLVQQLRSLGYDLIFVNQPTYTTTNLNNGQTVTIDGGAYYVESNAMAMVKLIQQTNAVVAANGSNAKIAIVGPSMGGQISRYALAYMEKNSLPHNTYLWISVDSPHLGSNVPMGDQALLNLIKESSSEAEDFYNKELNSPAGKQLLIELHKAMPVNSGFITNNYHKVDQNLLNAQTTSQGMSENRGDSYFQQHYNAEFNNGLANSKGYPMNLRKIAIVNGSLTGSKQAVALNGQPIYPFANDNEKVFNIRGFQRINISTGFGSITWRIHIGSLESQFMPSTGSGEQRISRFKKLFDDKTTISPNINPRGNMDNIPGGYFGAQNDIAGAVLGSPTVPGINLSDPTNWNSFSVFSMENFFKAMSERVGGSYWELREFNPIHSFIPTFSALGHLNPNQSWANPVNTNLTCPSNKQTPFDSYFGGDKNTQHTSFTKESVDWLLQELANNPQAPHFPIQAGALAGPLAICDNTFATFSIADICKVPSPVTTWSVTGYLQIVTPDAYSVILKGTSNIASEGTVTATFQNGQTLTTTIHVGAPNLPADRYIGGPNFIPNTWAGTAGAYVNPAPFATSYQWKIYRADPDEPCPGTATLPRFPNGNNSFYDSGTSTSVDIRWGNCIGDFYLTCEAVNDCGSTYYQQKLVRIGLRKDNPCHIGSPTTMKIAPNPFVGEVIIMNFTQDDLPCTFNEKDLPAENNNSSVTVTINNFFGTKVFSQTFPFEETITIPSLNLSPGVYIVNAQTSNGSLMRETIITR